MVWRVAPILIGLLAVAVFAGLLLREDDERAREADANAPATERAAPIAPQRILGRAPAFSDAPQDGTRLEENRPTQLGLPAPERFGPTGPRRALAEFLDAWHDRAWDRMALWTEPSWRAAAGRPAQELRRRFSANRLRGWAMLSDRRGPAGASIEVATATRGMRPALERERLNFELTRGPRGRWAVALAPPPVDADRRRVASLSDVESALAAAELRFSRSGAGAGVAERLDAPLIAAAGYETESGRDFTLLVFPSRRNARLARDELMRLPAVREGGTLAYGHNVVAVLPRRPGRRAELRTIERTLAAIDVRGCCPRR